MHSKSVGGPVVIRDARTFGERHPVLYGIIAVPTMLAFVYVLVWGLWVISPAV